MTEFEERALRLEEEKGCIEKTMGDVDKLTEEMCNLFYGDDSFLRWIREWKSEFEYEGKHVLDAMEQKQDEYKEYIAEEKV